MRPVLVLLLLMGSSAYAEDSLIPPVNDTNLEATESKASSGPLRRWNNGTDPVVYAVSSGPTRRWVNGRVLSTASVTVEDGLSTPSGPVRRWNNGSGSNVVTGGPARRWNNGH
jgi:hypothetical protein